MKKAGRQEGNLQNRQKKCINSLPAQVEQFAPGTSKRPSSDKELWKLSNKVEGESSIAEENIKSTTKMLLLTAKPLTFCAELHVPKTLQTVFCCIFCEKKFTAVAALPLLAKGNVGRAAAYEKVAR